MCLLPLETRAWSVPAPFAQFSHVVKHIAFIVVNLALENIPICSPPDWADCSYGDCYSALDVWL